MGKNDVIPENEEVIFNSLQEIQQSIDGVNEKLAEEEAKLQYKFDLEKYPLYKKRNEIVSKIPDFWQTAMEQHSLLDSLIEDGDFELVEAITHLEVEHPSVDEYVIIFYFKKNNLIKNEKFSKKVWKEQGAGGEIRISNDTLDFKDAKRKASEMNGEGFVAFLQDESDEAAEICNIFIADFYPNVLSYYQGAVSDECDDIEEEYDEDEE